MTEIVTCNICDVKFMIVGVSNMVAKGEVPPEVVMHINTPSHKAKKKIQEESVKALRAMIEVTPELDTPSVLSMWTNGEQL